MSVLVSMEGCLHGGTPSSPWDNVPLTQIFGLLHTVFNTITVAMRFEPANAKFFHQEVGIYFIYYLFIITGIYFICKNKSVISFLPKQTK